MPLLREGVASDCVSGTREHFSKKLDAQGIEPWTLYKLTRLSRRCKAYALPLRYAPMWMHRAFRYMVRCIHIWNQYRPQARSERPPLDPEVLGLAWED